MFDIRSLAARASELERQFLTAPTMDFSSAKQMGKLSGIYSLVEGNKTVHVGRTRNLAQRLRSHVSPSHNSASFALKRTRAIHQLETTYTKKGSRAEIVADPVYGKTFRDQIDKIRTMKGRFLPVEDPILQYLAELAITISYDLSLDGFDSH